MRIVKAGKIIFTSDGWTIVEGFHIDGEQEDWVEKLTPDDLMFHPDTEVRVTLQTKNEVFCGQA